GRPRRRVPGDAGRRSAAAAGGGVARRRRGERAVRLLSAAAAAVDKGLRELRAAWEATGSGWRDRARGDFADHHLAEIDARARLAARTLSPLEDTLAESGEQAPLTHR